MLRRDLQRRWLLVKAESDWLAKAQFLRISLTRSNFAVDGSSTNDRGSPPERHLKEKFRLPERD